MSGTQGWTQAVDGPEMFREMQKRLDRLERTVTAPPLGQVLGPGIADRGVEVYDWNAEETTYNGFFYSNVGAENTPDPDVRWIGLVLAQNDNNGVQQVCEGQPPEGEEPVLPPDPETVIPTEEEPEPEQPHVGNKTPVRQYIRYYSTSPEGVANFTPWQPLGLVTGARISDLADVKVFEPLLERSILLWDPLYNSVGGWVSTPYVPGVAEAKALAQEALDAAAGAIDTIGDLPPVYRQDSPPMPGSFGVPNPLPANSRWFDSNDGNKPYLWSQAQLTWLPVYTVLNDVTITGSLYAGGSINGTVVTGAGLQTSTLASTGVKITNTGIVGYGGGVAKFTLLASDGSLALAGPAITGGSLTGATVTGGVVQTATTGERVVIRNDGGGGILEFFSGVTSELTPSKVDPSPPYGGRPGMTIQAGTNTLNPNAPRIQMIGGRATADDAPSFDKAMMEVYASELRLAGANYVLLSSNSTYGNKIGMESDLITLAGRDGIGGTHSDTDVTITGTLNATMKNGSVGTGTFKTSVLDTVADRVGTVQPSGSVIQGTVAGAASGWQRIASAMTTPAGATLRGGVALSGTVGSLSVTKAGWYSIYVEVGFNAGTVAGVGRRAVAVGVGSTASPDGVDAIRQVVTLANNSSGTLSAGGLIYLAAGEIISVYRYTDVAGHYNGTSGTVLRLAWIG